jgi:hypothetical protein
MTEIWLHTEDGVESITPPDISEFPTGKQQVFLKNPAIQILSQKCKKSNFFRNFFLSISKLSDCDLENIQQLKK